MKRGKMVKNLRFQTFKRNIKLRNDEIRLHLNIQLKTLRMKLFKKM